ncbi:MAG TPA: hypothetical protein PLS53_15125 [Thermoanaerobaculaceae bacterium]|nr:hypothetical protein [Thermoanaerobaculaceae bacterium]HPS79490.1 hypothetical protein [Thermoanaerobaculaceae bacterium]
MREVFESIGELMAVALVYTAIGVTLEVMPATPPSAFRLGFLLAINFVVVAAGSWSVAHASGYGWLAGAGTAAVLGATQLLIPRLGFSLEARSGLRGMALLGVLAGLAALVAAAGLVMAFGPPGIHPAEAPPLVWLPHPPSGYAWRLPLLVVVYGVLQTAAVTLARTFLPPRVGGPDLSDLVTAQLVCGVVWVGALALDSLSLERRSLPIARSLVALVMVAGLAGRIMTYQRAPLEFWLPMTLLPALADGLTAALAAFLLLSPTGPGSFEPEFIADETQT